MEAWLLSNSVMAMLINQKVQLTVNLFGRTNILVGILEKYSKPFLKVKTKQGTRILNEFVVREIVPLVGD